MLTIIWIHYCLSIKMPENPKSPESIPSPSEAADHKKGTPPCRVRDKCPHGSRKSCCRKCKGSQICQHDRRRARCKECKGSGICPHDRVKERCKECKGIQICFHGRRREYCKDCKGAQICSHNRVKASCRVCKGSYFCTHNRVRTTCKECKGSQICQHDRLRQYCKECGGSGICSVSGNFKPICAHCNGKRVCQKCNFTAVDRTRKECASCFPIPFRASRCKEVKLASKLSKWACQDKIPKYTLWNKQNPLADPAQCGKYRVDFTFEGPVKVVLLECDEYQHSHYDKHCELVRQAQVSLGFGGLPVHWIRYNPDTFKLNNFTRKTTDDEREHILLRQLQLAFDNTDPDCLITITYICYDKKSSTSIMEDNDSDLQETLKFKTIEDYVEWTERTTSRDVVI